MKLTTTAPARPVTLCRVTIVDTKTGALTRESDMALAGGRIAAVTGASGADPNDGQRVELPGKFVVPGYVESHAHVLDVEDPSGAFDLMLVNGITGYRQMAGNNKLLRARREGTLPMLPSAPTLLATPGAVLTPLNAGSPAAATATVREQHAAGADFIKVGLVGPEAFFAAQAASRDLAIPILGHLPPGVDVRRASSGAMRSIEHLGPGLAVLIACSTVEEELRAAVAERPTRSLPFRVPFADRLVGPLLRRIITNPVLMTRPEDRRLLRRAVETFDEDRARALAEQFVADGTWHCPTLVRERTTQLSDDPGYRSDPHLRYVAPAMRKSWDAASAKFDTLPAEDKAVHRECYQVQLALLRILADGGVKILAGSDAGGAVWEVPGYAFHQELDELGAAGLSPLRVLQTATLDAAEFFGATGSMGTVEVGKNADLVVLDADPVASVAALHQIAGVVRQGRWYPAGELRSIAERVPAQSHSAPSRPTGCC